MKIDLHVHCSEASRCAHVPAVKMVQLYKEAGYDAIVLTNHFHRGQAREYAKEGKTDYLKLHKDTFHLAEQEGKKVGLKVFFGAELNFDENSNDYLVYGIPEDLLEDAETLWSMKAADFSEIARQRGFLFYQAHPFRNRMTVMQPTILFGIEVKNGHPRHDSRNEIAAVWAEKYQLHGISGSDAHQAHELGTAGIETQRNICSLAELVDMLRDDDYRIL